MKRYAWTLFFVMLFSVLWVGPAAAQQSTPPPSDNDVNRVAKQLYCPVCENTPLDVCPTQACAQWRELIRQKLADGWTDDQIKQYFVQQYGARVLDEPPVQGWNWFYIVPPVLVLLGIFILYRTLQSMRKPAPSSASAEAAPSTPPVADEDDYMRRVEEELKKRE